MTEPLTTPEVPDGFDRTQVFREVLHMFRDGDGWARGSAEYVTHDGKVSWCMGGAIGRAATGNPQAMNSGKAHPDMQAYRPFAHYAGTVLARAMGYRDVLETDNTNPTRTETAAMEALVTWNDDRADFTEVRTLITALRDGTENRLTTDETGFHLIDGGELFATAPMTVTLDSEGHGTATVAAGAPTTVTFTAGGKKSTDCAGGCCYNAVKDECVNPDCDCHAEHKIDHNYLD